MSEKIMFVANLFPSDISPYFGTFVKNSYDGFKENGYNIDSVVMTKENRSMKYYLIFYWNILKLVKKNNYKFIYIHYISHSALPFVLIKKKSPIILNVHGTDVQPTNKIQKILLFLITPVIKKACLIVTPSYDYKKMMIEQYKLNPENVFVSPSGGIDRKTFKLRIPLKAKINKNEELVIGYVSRIEKLKGWRTFIKLVKELENEKIKFKIVGSGSEIKEMWNYIDELKISHEIIEYSPAMSQKNLSKLFNEIDCLIFPSLKESLGLIGLEALSCGCTVIGSNITGINSYIDHRQNGYLFEKNNVEELKTYTLEYMNQSYFKRKLMMENGIKTAQKYDTEKITAELINRIRSIE